jgi:hypothetical protein
MPKSAHSNPWNGVCIHGIKGAIFILGVLTNPKCAHCQKGGNRK